MPRLDGTLERITYQSESDGYTVARLRPHDKTYIVTIVGKLVGVQVGETLTLDGRWVDHTSHGRQFEIERWSTQLPATVEGIRRYLGSGLVPGIGPATAQRIVDTFGTETLEIIEHHPERLREVKKLGRNKIDAIVNAWHEQRQIRTIMTFLQELQLTPTLAVRIWRQYGQESLRIVRDDPYRLADEVHGIGFLTADQIARGLGIAPDAPQRIAAGLRFALSRATDDGHCFLPRETLIDTTTELLEADRAQVAATLGVSILARSVTAEHLGGIDAVYLPPFAQAERGLASRLILLQRAESPIASFFAQADWSAVFAHLATKRGMDLSERQREAVRMALTSKASILTGGPGTGKTTCLRTAIMALQQRRVRFALAAPTGRAARRLAEATGAPALTVHRLLEYAPHGEQTFQRNELRPLDADVVIIDECGMLDVVLAYHLVKALPPQAHLLLVGDADQLPSVGPGRVLRDLLDSTALPSIHLDVIFRQSAGSDIVANAHRINRGEIPDFAKHADREQSCFFFARPEPEACAQLVVELVTERIPRQFGFDPQRDIQVITPTHRGPAGVAALNTLLQAALNPEDARKPERRAGAQVFRLGDRVLQLRNNYDLDIANGDIGVVAGIDDESSTLLIQFEGERNVRYPFDTLDELTLAYAISVHKSQGGEYPCVVTPLLLQHAALLQRNLIYTALTRAKHLAVLLGDRRALAQAVRNDRVTERYTGLADRLRG